jgi:hypothetical protein
MLEDDLNEITATPPSDSGMPGYALERIIFLSLNPKPYKHSAEENSYDDILKMHWCDDIFNRSLKVVPAEVRERLCNEGFVNKDGDDNLTANFQFIEKKMKEKGKSLKKYIGEDWYQRHLA